MSFSSLFFFMRAYCVLRTSYCVLRTAYCVLRTAYSVQRTAYCVLRTTTKVQYDKFIPGAWYVITGTVDIQVPGTRNL